MGDCNVTGVHIWREATLMHLRLLAAIAAVSVFE